MTIALFIAVLGFVIILLNPAEFIDYSTVFEYYNDDYLNSHSTNTEKILGTIAKVWTSADSSIQLLILLIGLPFFIHLTYSVSHILFINNPCFVLTPAGMITPIKIAGTNLYWSDIENITLKRKGLSKIIEVKYSNPVLIIKRQSNLYYRIILKGTFLLKGAHTTLNAWMLECSTEELYEVMLSFYRLYK